VRLVLIDGHAIIHRAYHAYPPLTTSKGEIVGAVYGFTSILLTVLQKLQPQFVAVTFDKKAPTFRHKKFKEYKAHRKPVDEQLIGQIPRVHEIVETLNIPVFELDGFEADDMIGTLARQADQEVIIVTGDADALQLVNNKVKVYMPARGKHPEKVYTEELVLEKYGVKPAQIVDLKALAGDPSDGIPGVKGIGPKTAAKLIGEFVTVEGIYKNLAKISPEISKKLKADRENAVLSKDLATIDTHVPIKLDLPCCTLTDYDKGKVLKLFEGLGFASLIKKLPSDDWSETSDGRKATLSTQKEIEKNENGEQMGLL